LSAAVDGYQFPDGSFVPVGRSGRHNTLQGKALGALHERPLGYERKRPPILFRPEPWTKRAACKDTPIELWFGDERQPHNHKPFRTRLETMKAKAICAGCPVLQECREWALRVPSDCGLVGGWTEAERRRILEDRAKGNGHKVA
jgi:WhiB family redox-sensing transcriptional regulator